MNLGFSSSIWASRCLLPFAFVRRLTVIRYAGACRGLFVQMVPGNVARALVKASTSSPKLRALHE